MRVKKILAVLLAAAALTGCICLPASAAQEGLANFQKTTREYQPGQFSDVGLAAWYTPYVAAVYELGLMQGNSIGAFCPGGDVTLAETAALAARLHKLYHTGTADFQQGKTWYRVYVDYCEKNGILLTEYDDYNAPAKRSEFAAILARALPVDALAEMNAVENGQIPDVPMGADDAAEIYLLYRAGVLTGNDAYGTFAPGSAIHRSEVAAIAARLAKPELRVSFAIRQPSEYPELTKQDRQENEFFADAAMLGNSLVQGMMLYSGISTMEYHCKESIRADNCDALVNALLAKQYGKIYIEFGINEVYYDVDTFTAAYGKLIDKLRAGEPDAEIYVMSLTPVTKSKAGQGFSISKIREMNDGLRALAEEKECWYVDIFTPLLDSSGYLSAAYAADWDGAHFNTSGYQAWAEVLRTYYAE